MPRISQCVVVKSEQAISGWNHARNLNPDCALRFMKTACKCLPAIKYCRKQGIRFARVQVLKFRLRHALVENLKLCTPPFFLLPPVQLQEFQQNLKLYNFCNCHLYHKMEKRVALGEISQKSTETETSKIFISYNLFQKKMT